jgi:hypothetical protein
VVEEVGPEVLKHLAGLPANVPKPLVAVTLPPEKLERLAGKYELTNSEVTVSRDGDHLKVLWDGKKATVLWPRSETSFFCKEWDCRMDFKDGKDGKPASVDIKMYYNTYTATKK